MHVPRPLPPLCTRQRPPAACRNVQAPPKQQRLSSSTKQRRVRQTRKATLLAAETCRKQGWIG